MVANGCSFAGFDGSASSLSNRSAVNVAAFAPFVPPNQDYTSQYAVFVLGPPNLRLGTNWGFYGSTGVLGTAAPQNSSSGGFPRMLAYRQPGVALTTPDGRPLITTAYVQFGDANTNPSGGEQGVVGILWDCAMVGDALSGSTVIAGQKYLVLASSNGADGSTVSTLVMAIVPEPTPTPVPPVPGGVIPPPLPPPTPTPPPPPLPAKSGTVNLFGFDVTWVSGDHFDATMNGQHIVINGTRYLVVDFLGPNEINVLVTVSTSAQNVPYSFPG